MPDESRPSQPRRQLVPEGTARAGRSLRKAAAFGLQCLIGIPLLLIALTMIFGPPVSLICETIDLCRMRERTTGRVDAVGVQSGNHGATRPHIEHHFTANGREVHSTRYAPGFVANWVRWTGGAKVARNFPIGRQVTVYFSASQPQRCVLEFGWFSWCVGFTAIFGGFALQVMGDRSRPRVAKRAALAYAGRACVVYGFGLIFVGPPVVRVRELPWHLLAWAGAVVVVLLWSCFRRIKDAPEPTHSPQRSETGTST